MFEVRAGKRPEAAFQPAPQTSVGEPRSGEESGQKPDEPIKRLFEQFGMSHKARAPKVQSELFQ